MGCKIRYAINTHKAMTIPVVIGLMYYYDNFGLGPHLYLAMHGSYCILYLLKECYFPDKNFDADFGISGCVFMFLLLGPCGYWMAPFLLIRGGYQPSPAIATIAIFIGMIGVFFHYCGDCQKYFMLKCRKGLIQEGLFSQSRNINYLGEVLTYLSFNIIAHHWLPFVCQAIFIAFVFYPNMLKKDRSLSRYEDFKKYKENTWLLFPKIL